MACLCLAAVFTLHDSAVPPCAHGMTPPRRRVCARRAFHRVEIQGEAPIERKGALKLIYIEMKRAAGHNKTHVSGLESFCISPDAVANALKVKLGCTTAVLKLPGNNVKDMEVLLQGHCVNEVVEYLRDVYCSTPPMRGAPNLSPRARAGASATARNALPRLWPACLATARSIVTPSDSGGCGRSRQAMDRAEAEGIEEEQHVSASVSSVDRHGREDRLVPQSGQNALARRLRPCAGARTLTGGASGWCGSFADYAPGSSTLQHRQHGGTAYI